MYQDRYQPFLFLLLFPVLCYAQTGDTLVIKGSVVNVHSGPGTEHAVILKLLRGREVTENQRQGEWLEILTERSETPTGWVHQSVTETVTETLRSVDPSPDFSVFLAEFNAYQKLRQTEMGTAAFVAAKDLGNKVIQITATDSWLQGERLDKETELTRLFNIWDRHAGSGGSLTVEIVDQSGDKLMSMQRQ